ncbi:sensor histidine kinase [Actinokineospora sp. NBRC 105648]|uniref:sensor histidine kinase n=1 Tax=Actinokineospora sp. NBRC 105648 TaxID=3032206 RepID=UPI0024A0F3FB|nr:sensor histidine kinase [Actinokineospora sp. NBRC 105648]GLZ36392.1 two-component sensor histidine kinase [Actinokineospora sp. NBRC 105648]
MDKGRLTPRQLVGADVALAAVVAFIVYGNLGAGAWTMSAAIPRWVGLVVVFTGLVPIALRRFWPVPVHAAALVSWLGLTAIGAGWEGLAAVLLTLYLVATTTPWRTSAVALAPALVISLAVVTGDFQVLACWLALGTTWTLGLLTKDRRETAALVQRQRSAEAVSAERLRIARELHDIVAHSLTLIAVTASVANHVAERRPEEGRAALDAIERTSRTALADLRRVLGMLRSGPDDVPLAPAPTPDELAALVRQTESAGVQVALVTDGIEDLPEGVGQSVYRIVQEALTNVVKHAAPAQCRVEVRADGTAVDIEVTDDGTRGHDGAPGHGLIGMRERVAHYDGDFTAGPAPDGGFTVRARLPYDRVDA